jgi:hypothetical protein
MSEQPSQPAPTNPLVTDSATPTAPEVPPPTFINPVGLRANDNPPRSHTT